MNEKTMFLWELTLNCNLTCDFCISGQRRKETSGKISFEKAIKIINNIPKNSHISFIGGENFLFPGFMDLLKYLDDLGITYEITSNGSLIYKFLDELNALKNLTNIYLSIDLIGEEHDKRRGQKGLFDKVIEIIPKIKTKVNINNIILPETKEEDIIKLNLLFNKLNISTHRISYYMNFNQNDIENSIKKIPELIIKTRFKEKINNEILKIKTIKIYKSLLHIKKIKNLKTNLDIHPISILKGGPKKCRSMLNYYRINEYGNISTCHFIDNEFGSLVENKFEEIIEKEVFKKLKNDIIKNYPLDICITCGKGE